MSGAAAQGADGAAAADPQIDEIDDGLTPEERTQFDDMKKATDAPAEGGDPPADAAPAEGGKGGNAAGVAAAAAADDDDDDDGEVAPAKPGADGKPPPRRVNYNKYRRVEERAVTAEKALQETRDSQTRLDERLRLLNEALTPKEAAAAADDEDPEPDPEKDIFGHARWQGRQIKRLTDVIQESRQTSAARDEEAQVANTYVEDARNFQATEPTFIPAYQFLMANRTYELAEYYFGKDLAEEGVKLTPQEHAQIKNAIADEERELATQAIKAGQSPAQRIFKLAKARGFRPPAKPAAAAAAAADPKNVAKVPGSLADPVKPGSAKPSVTEEIKNIQRGAASRSLSEGGGAPANPLTPERLANMPQDEFDAFMDALSPTEQRRAMGG